MKGDDKYGSETDPDHDGSTHMTQRQWDKWKERHPSPEKGEL